MRYSLLFFLAMVFLFAVVLNTSSLSATENIAEETCYLPDHQPLKLPSHFTFVQRAYFIELCHRASDEYLRAQDEAFEILRVERMVARQKPEKCDSCEEEIRMRTALKEAIDQHVKNIVGLLEKAVIAEPFNEEAFWKAWILERSRYKKTADPFYEWFFAKARKAYEERSRAQKKSE